MKALTTLGNIATALAVISSVATAAIVVHRSYTGSPVAEGTSPSTAPRAVDNWESYIQSGRLIGSSAAPLTFVEFADFQCPACRALHSLLDTLKTKYPGAFAVSYHYVPLPYHPRAYAAARAAECAADQGHFEAFHDALFRHFADLDTIQFATVAREARVPDVARFVRCASDTTPVSRIERDKALAMDTLHIAGTPTLVVNGKLYNFAPQISDLRHMIEDAQTRRRRN